MHRKSMEAAQQLKEVEDSDRESTTSRDKSDSSQSQSQHQPQAQEQCNKELRLQSHHQQQHPHHHDQQSSQQHNTSQAPPPQQSLQIPTDPEEFRNNSIACLRAKAQEHSAKILSDAVRRSTAAALLNGNVEATHDSNANITSQMGERNHGDILTSSDTSSSLF